MRKEAANLLKNMALGGVLIAATSGVYAANDGTIGATSTGDLNISLQVDGAVKISNLSDITLGPFTGADVSGTSPACVYSNSGGGYTITATATGGAFNLANGGNNIAYNVSYNDGSGLTPLSHGVAAAKLGASATDDDCVTAGADNGTIQVDVLATNASAVPQGSYASVLTLLVSPN